MFFLEDEVSAHLEGTFGLHGEQVSIEGDQVQAVLLPVDEGAQHTLLLQPLLTQEASARHKQDVEISLRGAASVFPGKVTAGAQHTVTHCTGEQHRPRAGGTGSTQNRNSALAYCHLLGFVCQCPALCSHSSDTREGASSQKALQSKHDSFQLIRIVHPRREERTLCIAAKVKPPCQGVSHPHLSRRVAVLQFGVCTSFPAQV